MCCLRFVVLGIERCCVWVLDVCLGCTAGSWLFGWVVVLYKLICLI